MGFSYCCRPQKLPFKCLERHVSLGVQLFGWMSDPMMCLLWVHQRENASRRLEGCPGAQPSGREGDEQPVNYSSQLTLEEFGQTRTDIFFWQKWCVSNFPYRNKEQNTEKSNSFFIKNIKFCAKTTTHPYQFLYTKNNTGIENYVTMGKASANFSNCILRHGLAQLAVLMLHEL